MSALAILAVTTAQACSSQQSDSSHLDYGAIAALAGSATNDAQELEKNADAIAAATSSRSNPALWLNISEELRAAARSLRILASNAKAVVRVRQQNLDDPGGMLSDGLSLLRPGETLLRQTEALDADIRLLREAAVGDEALHSSVQDLSMAVKDARGDASIAVQQGELLVERARRIARSLGTDIE